MEALKNRKKLNEWGFYVFWCFGFFVFWKVLRSWYFKLVSCLLIEFARILNSSILGCYQFQMNNLHNQKHQERSTLQNTKTPKHQNTRNTKTHEKG